MHEGAVIEVRVSDLSPEHIGMQIEVVGRWEDLHGFSHQGKTSYEKSRLHVGLLRELPEMLFLDAELNGTVKLRKPKARVLRSIITIPVATPESFSRGVCLAVSKLWR